jgi:hypothetical protein
VDGLIPEARRLYAEKASKKKINEIKRIKQTKF